MLVKILGVLDIFIAVCFWLFGILHIIQREFILILGLVLLAKGLIFIIGLSFVSFLDIFFGTIIIIATLTTLPKIVIIIAVLFLFQKGVFSLL